MPISAGTVVDKISEVRSKIAVFEGLILHLKSNYLSSEDTGEPEMKFYRGDYAPVPELHVSASVADLEQHIVDLRAQLAQWEGIMVDVDEPSPTGGGGGGGGKNKSKKKEPADGTSGRDQDHPARQAARPPQDG